ncbi:MAG: ABC transporter ATP-binding protein, partial [Abditibacteriota bacterium]|nr:ABC transporter ATP-binding protein [Abditibacteriota bacterium]
MRFRRKKIDRIPDDPNRPKTRLDYDFNDDRKLSRSFDKDLAKGAFEFLKPHKLLFFAAMVLWIMTSALGLAEPWLTKIAIDDGIRKLDAAMLTRVCILILAVYLLRWGIQYCQSLTFTSLGQKVTNSIRIRLFEHIQHQSLGFFKSYPAGSFISRIMGDVNAINRMITNGAVHVIVDFGTAIVVFFIMWRLNRTLTLWLLLTVPMIVAATLILRRFVRQINRETRRKNAAVIANMSENVAGVRVVKSFVREKAGLQNFRRAGKNLLKTQMRAVVIGGSYSIVVDFISLFGMMLVLIIGAREISMQRLTLGGFIAFLGYIGRFFNPVRSVSQYFNTMQAAMAGAERIFGILNYPPEIQDRPGAEELTEVKGHVQFRDVTFGYEDDKDVIKGVSIEAMPGQTVALVGSTGAGKTTLINLLSRQYDVRGGSIELDGKDIRDITCRSLRSAMGVVLQDAFLFPGSIMENIRYGRLDAADEEVIRAAEFVGAHEFITAMPRGYDTDVREGASRLSTGQKQLISFARALIADPAILVLDEATSSVDTKTEKLIQYGLAQLFRDRTCFVVAHRLSTIASADLICVVEDGRIVV